MKVRPRALVALALVLTTACGYALVGRGTVTDPSIRRIGVPLFKDGTGKPGLDQKITEKVVEELLKRGRFDVVGERVGVDALVEGELVRYDASPVGFTGAGADRTQASRYGITLTARVRYTKTGETEPLWHSDAFSFREEYDVGSDPTNFINQEDQAIERLCASFARSLVAAMLEAF